MCHCNAEIFFHNQSLSYGNFLPSTRIFLHLFSRCEITSCKKGYFENKKQELFRKSATDFWEKYTKYIYKAKSRTRLHRSLKDELFFNLEKKRHPFRCLVENERNAPYLVVLCAFLTVFPLEGWLLFFFITPLFYFKLVRQRLFQ